MPDDGLEALGVLARYPHSWMPREVLLHRIGRPRLCGERAPEILVSLLAAGWVVAWTIEGEARRDGKPVPPHCRGEQVAFTPEAAEALGIEIGEAVDESPRWFQAEARPGEPSRCAFGLPPLPVKAKSPGWPGFAPLRFPDRIAARDEPEPEAFLMDPVAERPVILWGRPIPIRKLSHKARRAG